MENWNISPILTSASSMVTQKNRPWIEKKIKSITIGKPQPGLCPKEFENKEFFIIKFK